MKRRFINRRTVVTIISAMILLTGTAASIYIYHTASEDSGDVIGYEIIDGTVYPIRPEDSKTYRHDLELYGGKAAVLADEFSRWFVGLFHGKSLAYTIFFITTIVSSGIFFGGTPLQTSESDSSGERHGDAPD
jgi:hypothetical protein